MPHRGPFLPVSECFTLLLALSSSPCASDSITSPSAPQRNPFCLDFLFLRLRSRSPAVPLPLPGAPKATHHSFLTASEARSRSTASRPYPAAPVSAPPGGGGTPRPDPIAPPFAPAAHLPRLARPPRARQAPPRARQAPPPTQAPPLPLAAGLGFLGAVRGPVTSLSACHRS